MKTLITGGAGFIASNIADRLIAEGHQVGIVDNLLTGKEKNIPREAIFYKEDIRNYILKHIFEVSKPEVVLHYAAQIDVRKSVENPAYDLDINGMGMVNVLEQCRKNNVKKVIYASSGGCVYGNTNKFPTPETEERRPESPYGITKMLGEQYLDFYNKVHGLNYTILRYGNIYGPRQDSKGEAGVIDIFANQMLDDKPIIIYGDGEQIRDYTFVGDVVNANVAALTKGDNQVFNIASERPISVKNLYHIINNAMGQKSDAVYMPARKGELMRSELDCTKAHDILGWKAKVSLEDGIRQTIQWIKENK